MTPWKSTTQLLHSLNASIETQTLQRLMRLNKYSSRFLTTALTTASLLISGTANAILGGETGFTQQPWVVEILQTLGKREGKCSGAAINELLVITAKHCVANYVSFTDGSRIAVASVHPISNADLQVLVLTQGHSLDKYPKLGPNYLKARSPIPVGTRGMTYGYGGVVFSPQKKMNVEVIYHSNVEQADEIFWVKGLDGEAEEGDSGAPLIFDDMLMGLLHASYEKDDGIYFAYEALYPAISTIRQLEHAREMRSVDIDESVNPWISKVRVSNQRLYVDMSSKLVNSGKKVVIWVNGKYVGSVWNDISYYCEKFNYDGGSEISPLTPIHGGDLIQIGIDESAGPNSPSGSQMLFETRNNGVEVVKRLQDVITFRLSSELVNSGKRVIIWYDGVYAAEAYNGSVFYSTVVDIPGGKNFFPNWRSVPLNTVVAVGVVDGVPGTPYGTPDTAKQILYKGIPEVQE